MMSENRWSMKTDATGECCKGYWLYGEGIEIKLKKSSGRRTIKSRVAASDRELEAIIDARQGDKVHADYQATIRKLTTSLEGSQADGQKFADKVGSNDQIQDLMAEIDRLKLRLHETEEDYLMYRKNYEECQLKISEMKAESSQLDREGSSMKRLVEDLTLDKQRQRNEFMVMQSKALKMTGVLKRLAMNISTYLEENKLLRKKLERCDKRQHLGFHDMTPRPDYREIFKRREFKHFKEDFILKIMQQEYSTVDIVEQLIDVVKAYESKLHFTGGSNRVMPESLNNLKLSKDKTRQQTKPGIPRTSTQDILIQFEGRNQSRGESRRQIALDGLSKNEENLSRRSSQQNNQASPSRGGVGLGDGLKNQPKKEPKREDSGDSEGNSLDSMASKLSDQDYKDIKTIGRGMEEINKDFTRLVNI